MKRRRLEIRVGCRKRKQLPKKPSRPVELTTLIAHLGRYNTRATEASPGSQTIWVGMRHLVDFTIAWESFGSESSWVVSP